MIAAGVYFAAEDNARGIAHRIIEVALAGLIYRNYGDCILGF